MMLNPTSSAPLRDEWQESPQKHNPTFGYTKNSILDSDLPKIQRELTSVEWNVSKQNVIQWQNPPTLVQLGDVQVARNMVGTAIKHYKNALKQDPSFLVAYPKLVQSLLSQQRVDDARTYYEQWVENAPDNYDLLHGFILFQLFFYGYKNGQVDTIFIDELIERLESILKEDKSNYRVVNSIGFIYLNYKSETKIAKRYFKKSSSINEKYEHPVNNLGVCYLREKNVQKAKLEFATAKKLNDQYNAPYQNLANIEINSNCYENALKILLEAKSLGVSLENNWENKIAWLLLKTEDYEKAIEAFTKRLEIHSESILLRNDLGVCYMKTRNYANAQKVFHEAIEIFESKAKKGDTISNQFLFPYYNLARTYRDTDNLRGLKNVSIKLEKISKSDSFLLYIKGAIKLRERDYEEAYKYFKKALSLDEMLTDAYPDISFIYTSIKQDYKSAIELLEKARSLGISSIVATNNLVFAYLKTNEITKAEGILLNIKPLPEFMLPTMGLYQFKKGNFKKADAYYKKGIEVSQENKDIIEQVWLFEKANYLSSKRQTKTAIDLLERALSMKDSYMTPQVKETLSKLAS